MVLTPKEARNAMLNESAPFLADLEKRIDKALIRTGGNATLGFQRGYVGPYDDPRTHVPYAVIEALLDNYRAAGGDAKLQSDWRDGDYIDIKPRETQRNDNYTGPYGCGGPRPYE